MPQSLLLYFDGDKCLNEVASISRSGTSHRAGGFISGPESRAAQEAKLARETFKQPEPDSPELQGKIAIRIMAPRTPGCAGFMPAEVVFLENRDAQPALRIPLVVVTQEASNAMGAKWKISEGFAYIPAQDFKGLSAKSYEVYVISNLGRSFPAKVKRGELLKVR